MESYRLARKIGKVHGCRWNRVVRGNFKLYGGHTGWGRMPRILAFGRQKEFKFDPFKKVSKASVGVRQID